MKNEEPHIYAEKLLQKAVDCGASDLYWLPEEEQYRIRMRVNGLQKKIGTVPLDYGIQAVTRLKVMAGMLTYKTRIAQDGVIREFADSAGIEIRCASMPTSQGERMTLRIFNQNSNLLNLEDLGYSDEILSLIQKMLQKSSGLIILNGPTGSGKTTTIYAMIRELLKTQQDPATIITLEDPIECEIPEISQVNVAHDSEWGYADALRATLRQDVKTIIVGELRDPEVLKVTLDAALTGHRVITTYHADDIPSIYARMLHQGFDPFLIASAVTGAITQRVIPSIDGEKMVCAAAAFIPDDNWIDFLAKNPGLNELRNQIKKYPVADLQTSVKKLADADLIEKSELLKI